MTNYKEIYEKYQGLSDKEVCERLEKLKTILDTTKEITTDEDKRIYRLVYVLATNLVDAGKKSWEDFLETTLQQIKYAESLEELDKVVKHGFEADTTTDSWRSKPVWTHDERENVACGNDNDGLNLGDSIHWIIQQCKDIESKFTTSKGLAFAAKSARAILISLECYVAEKKKNTAHGQSTLMEQIEENGILGLGDQYADTKKYDAQVKTRRMLFLGDPNNYSPAIPGTLAKIVVPERTSIAIEEVGLKPEALRKSDEALYFDRALIWFGEMVDHLKDPLFEITENFTKNFEVVSVKLKKYLDTSRWTNIWAGSEGAWKAYDDKPFVKYYYCARRLFKDRKAGKGERKGLMAALRQSEHDAFFVGGASTYDKWFDQTEQDQMDKMELIEKKIRKKLTISDDIVESCLKNLTDSDIKQMEARFQVKRGKEGDLSPYQVYGCCHAAVIKKVIDEKVKEIERDPEIQDMIDRYVREYVVTKQDNEEKISNKKENFKNKIIDRIVAIELKRFFALKIFNKDSNSWFYKALLKEAIKELDSKKETATPGNEENQMVIKEPSGVPGIPVVKIDSNGQILGFNLKDQIQCSKVGVMIDCLSQKMRDKKDTNADDPLDEIIRGLIEPSDRYFLNEDEERKHGGIGYIAFNNTLRKEIEIEEEEEEEKNRTAQKKM